MLLVDNIHFFEGDYVNAGRQGYFQHYRGIGSSNFLVVRGREQVMIDSGLVEGPHRRRLDRQLADDGIRLSDTDAILFSHAHPDHTVMAKGLARGARSGRPIRFMMHEDNEPLTRNREYLFETYFNFPDYFRQELFVFPRAFIKQYLKYLGLAFDYLRIDGFFGASLELASDLGGIAPVDLYGHCQGHCGYFFPRAGVLYCGDLFDTRCAKGASLIAADSSWARAVEDIRKLMAMDIETLVPGHGSPIRGRAAVRAALSRLLDETLAYKRSVLAALAASGRAMTISELHDDLYGDSIAYNAFSRKIIIYNILRELAADGSAGVRVAGGRGRWAAN